MWLSASAICQSVRSSVPVWYGYEPGGDVEVIMGSTSITARLIEATGRVTLTVQREEVPYKYVMVEGPVVETRPAEVDTDTRPMARRYLFRQCHA